MKEIRNVHLITRANGTRPRQVAVLTLSASTSNSYGLIPPDTQMKNKYASRFPNLKPMAYRNSLRLPVDPGLVLLENSWGLDIYQTFLKRLGQKEYDWPRIGVRALNE